MIKIYFLRTKATGKLHRMGSARKWGWSRLVDFAYQMRQEFSSYKAMRVTHDPIEITLKDFDINARIVPADELGMK